MTDLSNFRVTDNLVEALAAQYNRVVDATLRGEMSNSETLAANKTLTELDFALQVYAPTAAREVTLPAVGAANHPFYIVNTSATYALTVKNAGGTTIGTVGVSSAGIFASNGTVWYALASVPLDATASVKGILKLTGQLGGTADGPIVTGMTETGGPTALTLGAVPDGAILKRIGATLVGAMGGHGQCYLSKSGANLLLSPHNGNQLIINSVSVAIPDAGVTLAPPAVASTTYYIYAYMNGTTMTLEQSATAPAAQAGTGVQIKSGDATRTLVGMARTNAANAWVDSVTQRFVLSFFNRKSKGLNNSFTATRSTTSATVVEINSEIRCEFLTWADEAVQVAQALGATMSGTGSENGYISIGFDGTTPEDAATRVNGTSVPSLFLAVANALSKSGLTEGYHYATVLGKISGGVTLYLIGDANVGQRGCMTVTIRG